MEAIDVLKCQRESKSSVTLRMVWCSFRRMRASAGPCAAVAAGVARDEAVDAAEEAVHALDAGVLPVHVFLGRRGEQDEEARGVGAVALGGVVGADHVALGLGHLRAVLDHHALREEARGGLVVGDQAEVAHHLGEEARVDQVQDGVLDAADVLVDGEPVSDLGASRTGPCRSARRSSGRSTTTNR